MVFSTTVGDGEDTLATQYNNLRLDVLDPTSGHDHDGTASGGKKVGHGDLVDGAIASTYLTHIILSKHVQGAGTDADPDAGVGGKYGVHELDAPAMVAGSLVSQHYFQSGSAVLQSVDAAWTSGVFVSFGATFANTPMVHVTLVKNHTYPPPMGVNGVYVDDESPTGFWARGGPDEIGATVNWLAVDNG